MAALADATARRDAIVAELAAGSGGVNHSLDGQTVDYAAYRRALLDELKYLNEVLIPQLAGPFQASQVIR